MILKRQGYYKEMPHGDNADPSILDFIQKIKCTKMRYAGISGTVSC